MSKDFFEKSEFEARQAKVRKAMATQDLDLMMIISPVNINYLIGAAAKAYQVFQCLLFPRDVGPLTLVLRMSDVAEVKDHSLATDVRGWNGFKSEDPITILKSVLGGKGLRKRGAGAR